MEIPSDSFPNRQKVQIAFMVRWMGSTQLPPEDWCGMGYADAFEQGWKNQYLRRNPEALYDFVIRAGGKSKKVNVETKVRTRNILDA